MANYNEVEKNPEEIKGLFKYFLKRCCKTGHRTENNPLYMSGNAPNSYMSFLEVNRLFDYNPSKWKHIDSIYSITNPQIAEEVFNQLISDPEFVKRDKEDNQGWRSGAIGYYVCFLNTLDIFGKTTNEINTLSNSSIIGQSPLQTIYYGAPGTGKSHDVKIQTGELDASGNKHEKLNVFRTTFHPDTDYATFVGCYKPTMKPVAEKYRAVAGKEEEIVYEFVPQAFTDAYIYAYTHTDIQTYLVIEEINRGNCAQIFGDLFQLLDRKADGTSEYTIKADKDLANYLITKLGNDSEGIRDGKLRLPANLNILATMNTSDQSLFPMDSAFKRRWDWEYMPIKYSNTDWKIDIAGTKYNWVDFQTEINKRVFDATDSEDKQLGDYFVKADANNIISAKLLLNKVIFYLWNDVCKDGDGDIFKINTDLDYTKELDPANNEDITFSQFFENTDLKLQQWMRYLDIKPN